MINKKIAVKWFSVLAFLFMMSASTSLAEPCNGDFGGDGDVDGSDAVLFKKDMGRKNCTNAPVPVPKTGQTTCYDTAGNPRDCAGTGEDGEYQKGVATTPRFTDHGNGTVTDNLTGLMWTKDAQQIPGIMTWQAALDACNNLVYPISGGYDDWRLPNLRELQSLIDYKNYFPALPSGHPFTNEISSNYWSSTTYASHPDGAWVVGFGGGDVGGDGKSYGGGYVRAVRSGQ